MWSAPKRPAANIETALALIEELRPAHRRLDLAQRDMSLFVKGLRICYAKARSLLRDGLERKEMPLLHEARNRSSTTFIMWTS